MVSQVEGRIIKKITFRNKMKYMSLIVKVYIVGFILFFLFLIFIGSGY